MSKAPVKKQIARQRAPKKPTVPRRKSPPARRRNPGPNAEMQEAAALSEKFHGRPATKAREFDEPADERQVLTELGALVSLTVKSPAGKAEIIFDKGTKLAASPDGGQLYIVGGDQSIDQDDLELSDQDGKDHVEIGACTHVTYYTRKGFDKFEPVNYKHRFGEDGGTPPTLCADRINDRLYFVGGSYEIHPEGITN